MEATTTKSPISAVMKELVVFRIGNSTCGLMIDNIQEINQNMELTEVYGSPDFVRGVINLRGQIVTIIDLRKKFGLETNNISLTMRNVVVKFEEEHIGLLVDRVDDIIIVDINDIQPPPSHDTGEMGKYFTGVYMLDDHLVAILDVEKILSKDS